MRHKATRPMLILLVLIVTLAACREEEETPTATATAPEAAATPTPAATLAPEAAEETEAEPEATAGAEPEAAVAEPIYLAIIWHQHQPVYFKVPDAGVYIRPWVRVHAAKDYVDMAAILREYPEIHATFNLTPSLIRQLDDLAAGARDLYWVHTEIPAAELTQEEQQFILDRFFDTNRNIIGRFPRYQALLDLRDSSEDPLVAFSEQDFRDLQLLFNLAWTDPEWLAAEPLAGLVAKGEQFSEQDKETILAEHQRLVEEVIPIHRQLQDEGQIEVTMTPFAHPILPLLVTTDLARQAMPDAELPNPPFVSGQDAQRHVELGVQLYEEHFGRAPRGMWPAEGSVAEEIVTMVSRNGIQWMASDEGVLAQSLGIGSFTRNSADTVQEATQLYRPYFVQGQREGPVAIIFRDVVISDKVGFTYSGMEGEGAAADFVDRIHAIRQQLEENGEEGPYLVSVILDGENAWEHYDNDGKAFLHGLYRRLAGDPLIQTVTPSEFLAIAPDQPAIDELWAGSWITADFSTWIGEDEENRAWKYLRRVREFLQPYVVEMETPPSAAALEEAITLMYIAEGSDWFWWYGSDQNSGDDGSFDEQFRDTLKGVYLALEQEPPTFLDVPIIPQQPATAAQPLTDLIAPDVDGITAEEEWASAAVFLAEDGAMATARPIFDGLAAGFDSQNLYLKIDLTEDAAPLLQNGVLDLYLSAPGSGAAVSFSEGGSLLGFPANRRVTISASGSQQQALLRAAAGDEEWEEEGVALEAVAAAEGVVELGIPLDLLNNADVGDRLSLRLLYAEAAGTDDAPTLVDAAQMPGGGPAVFNVPDLGNITVVLDVADPAGDDHGPGTYTYPEDGVFSPGNFDVVNFQVGYDDENVIFKFTVDGPLDNPWDSPNGLSVQTFDVYVDQGGEGGGRALLPGRNLALEEGTSWDYAITAEGWTPAVHAPADAGPEKVAEASQFSIVASPGQRRVTIRVPKSILGETPEAWSYAAIVLGQEGFPSSGVMRVRDVAVQAEQWRFGGAPPGVTNHTRAIDFVWPEPGQQEDWLGDFTPTDDPQTDLTDDDFATVPMLAIPAD